MISVNMWKKRINMEKLRRIKYGLILLLFLPGCLDTPDPEIHFLSEIYYPELDYKIGKLDPAVKSEYWLNILDFSDKSDYDAGYIDYANQIDLSRFIDTAGRLLNHGRVVTNNYDNQWPFIVYSSSNDTIAYVLANILQSLGYTQVYFYSGGTTDWLENGGHLNLTYEGFKAWYNNHHPFEDTMQALIDIHPYSWYRGDSILSGHIPGAINIPAADLVESSGGSYAILDSGKILTDTITDLSAKIVVYHSMGNEELSNSFLWAAAELGYTNLYLFPDGYDQWLEHGQEITGK